MSKPAIGASGRLYDAIANSRVEQASILQLPAPMAVDCTGCVSRITPRERVVRVGAKTSQEMAPSDFSTLATLVTIGSLLKLMFGSIGMPELIGIAGVLLWRYWVGTWPGTALIRLLRRRPERPETLSERDKSENRQPEPAPPTQVLQPQVSPLSSSSVQVELQPDERRIRVAMEVVRAPRGVTIRVRRARTVQHDIKVDWHHAFVAEGGLQTLVKASIRDAIERKYGRTYTETEEIAYDVELDGSNAEQYTLTWVDVMLTGTSAVAESNSTERMPFEFRLRSELEVAQI